MTSSNDNTIKQLESVNVEQQPVEALDAALVVLNHIESESLITEWDSEKSVVEYQKYLSNLDQYEGKLIAASKAYFDDYLQGKTVQTKIGLVRISSKSKGKIHDRMRDIKYLAIPYIPEVLMTGDVSDLIPLNKDRTDYAAGYYHFTKIKELSEFNLKITLKVAMDEQGNLLYFLGASKEKSPLTDSLTGSRPQSAEEGFDSITPEDDDEINLEVQILDKYGNVLSDEEVERLLFGQNQKANKKVTSLMTSPISVTEGRNTGGRDRLLNVLHTALSVNNPAANVFTGRSNTVKTAKGTKLDTVFALVEADQLIASHDATGGTNPKFPQELQPRDRGREASQAWVQKTAANLDPDSLGKTGRADTGAPIVGDDLVVESGNGRTMAIQLAYARDTAQDYKNWLIEEATYFGFKPEQVEALKQPVLVRIRKTPIDRAAFAVEANQDDKLSFSATERAKSDAKRIDDNMTMLFNPSEDGDLMAASNQKFIQAFLLSLGDTEAAQYTTTDGKPTQALDRVKAEDLSSQIVDGMEQAIDKRVINAIIDAANVVMTAKNDGQDVAEFVKQQGLFGDLPEGVPELAVFLATNSRSAKKMSLLFKAMAEYLEKQAFEQSTIGLFGEPEPVKMQDVISYATSVIEQEYGDKANLSMFDCSYGFEGTDEGFQQLVQIFYKKGWMRPKTREINFCGDSSGIVVNIDRNKPYTFDLNIYKHDQLLKSRTSNGIDIQADMAWINQFIDDEKYSLGFDSVLIVDDSNLLEMGFDSITNHDTAELAGIDIDAEPLAALDACLRVLQFNPARYIPVDQNLKYSLEVHDQVMQQLLDGTLSIADYQQSFQRMKRDVGELAAQLEKLTKPQIFKQAGAYFEYRYKNDNKERVTRAYLENVLRSYNLESIFSWSPPIGGTLEDSRNAMLQKLQQGVDATTQEQLDSYAMDHQAERRAHAEALAAKVAGIENPQTLDDFINLLRSKVQAGLTINEARMQLTPKQRQQYDLLSATKSRGERLGNKETGKAEVKTAIQTSAGTIVETIHTKHGHDLFVVQLADRVDKDSYSILNANAKKLGGYYSSFRGNGAVVGFQFKTRDAAEAFLKLAGGDASDAQAQATEQRNVFLDDKTQSAAERLTSMAERLQQQAEDALERPRMANTARRARMAASAELEANKDKALAQTMFNIADSLKNGNAQFLNQVRQKVQVEYLAGLLNSAKMNEVQSQPNLNGKDREALRTAPPTLDTVDYVTFPSYTAYKSDLATLARKMMGTDGTKLLGQKLFKLVDDSSAEYEKFAKENLVKVSRFALKDGQYADFTTKKQANDAIERGGFNGKAIALLITKGQTRIVLSPSEAIQQGIWQGADERITISNQLGRELMEKIGAKNRKGADISLPWSFEATYEAHKRLQGMELVSAPELRSALREFVLLQATPQEPDQIKQLERAMVGQANDGLDFFPTPESTVREMIQIADISEGMRVLEPSAGMGHIAELIRQEDVEPDVIEFSSSRRELLELKGFNVIGHDFMEVTQGDYDRIIMNPPFSNRQDAKHVQHAYSLLNAGGRLVAIMGEGVFFGQDKVAVDFRNWLEQVGGTSEKLGENTFMDANLPVNTGANARLVVIEK